MSTKKNKITFEEAFCNLENVVKQLKQGETTLEESLKLYEKGLFYHSLCSEILKEAKNRIQIFDRDAKKLKELT